MAKKTILLRSTQYLRFQENSYKKLSKIKKGLNDILICLKNDGNDLMPKFRPTQLWRSYCTGKISVSK